MPNSLKQLLGLKPEPKKYYSLATLEGNRAEINMYGDVVESRPVDWWTGEPISGDFIMLDEFMKDLETLKQAKHIDIHMNSVGGSVYAALPIYNRLNELDAEITVTVDGVAMSAASFIMCAADTIKVNSTSIVMIHKAMALFLGWYNADDARKDADTLDTYDRALASAYVKKTGLSENEILQMMSATTYMTGAEAFDKGFADEVIDGGELDIAASADGKTVTINGRTIAFPGTFLGEVAENIQKVTTEAGEPAADLTNTKQPGDAGNLKGGTPMFKSLEEMKAQEPELYATCMAEARTAVSEELGNAADKARADERKRIQDIDAIAKQFDDETVSAAKYGEKPLTAQEMAFNAAVKAAEDGKKALGDLKDDAKNSGTQDVQASPGPADNSAGESIEDVKAEAKKLAEEHQKTFGGKK